MNTKSLEKTKVIVEKILETDECARNSDTYLYRIVLYKYGQEIGIDFGAMPTDIFFKVKDELGVPKFKSVERARRKVQEEHPELEGCKKVKKQRKINESIYKEFAITRRKLNE